MQPLSDVYNLPLMASGEKTQARHILAAIRALSHIEQAQRPATLDERERLSRFAGFGKVALSLFPNPVTGRYKDESWQELGEALRALLSDEEYDSAKRTTFTAFYTSPVVIEAMHEALAHLGVPENATVLEPGCGNGRFMSQAPKAMRFIGIELDSLSGRIARALHPGHDIRIENFRDTRLPENRIDAVIGNVPFADIRLDYGGQKLALHDFFMAKSLDALKPGGILALITSHYTLDKQNAGLREHLAGRADFLGAIRLPSDAFKQEGTRVVTDILFLHKREADQAPRHAHDGWLETATLSWKVPTSPSTVISSSIPRWSWAPGAGSTGSMAASGLQRHRNRRSRGQAARGHRAPAQGRLFRHGRSRPRPARCGALHPAPCPAAYRRRQFLSWLRTKPSCRCKPARPCPSRTAINRLQPAAR